MPRTVSKLPAMPGRAPGEGAGEMGEKVRQRLVVLLCPVPGDREGRALGELGQRGGLSGTGRGDDQAEALVPDAIEQRVNALASGRGPGVLTRADDLAWRNHPGLHHAATKRLVAAPTVPPFVTPTGLVVIHARWSHEE